MIMIKRLFLYLACLLLLTSFASAVGIGTQKFLQTYDAFPGDVLVLRYGVYPNSDIVQDYKITVSGDIGKISTIEPPSPIKQLSKGDVTPFTVTIKIPEGFPGGLYLTHITVMESTPYGGDFINVLTAASDDITVKVYNKGKFMKSRIDQLPLNDIDTPAVKLVYENWGTEAIQHIYSDVGFYTSEGKLLKIVNRTGEVPFLGTTIASENRVEFPSLKLASGTYHVRAEIHAADVPTLVVEKDIVIGEQNVVLLNYTSNIEVKKINRMNFTIQSKWNHILKDVYLAFTIPQLDGVRIQSSTFELGRLEKKDIIVYWDVGEIDLGLYEGYVSIFFNKTDKQYNVSIMAYNEAPKPREESPFSMNLKLDRAFVGFGIIIILILVALISSYWIYRLER